MTDITEQAQGWVRDCDTWRSVPGNFEICRMMDGDPPRSTYLLLCRRDGEVPDVLGSYATLTEAMEKAKGGDA